MLVMVRDGLGQSQEPESQTRTLAQMTRTLTFVPSPSASRNTLATECRHQQQSQESNLGALARDAHAPSSLTDAPNAYSMGAGV